MSNYPIYKGGVYIVDLPIEEGNCVEYGIRPAVVVSSNYGNSTNEVVMICPMTTKLKKLSCNVDVSWSLDDRKTQVICNQIITIPKSRLLAYKGYVSSYEMQRVNAAILLSLGLLGGDWYASKTTER